MAKMQVAVLAALVLIAISRQICEVSCKRHPRAPDKTWQDSAERAPPLSDLNRTSAHPQPARPSIAPAVRPRELVATQSPQASRRVAAHAAAELHEDRNRTTNQIKLNSSTLASQWQVQAVGGGASLASVRSRWRQMEQTVARSMSTASSDLKKTLDEIYSATGQHDALVSPPCKKSLDELVEGLRDQELWAIHMMDSSAAVRGLPSGLLEGTLTDLGHFDECLAIGQRLADPTSGQYCSVLIKPPLVGRPRLHTVCRRVPSLSPMLSSSISSLGTGNSTLRMLAQQSHQFYYAGLRLGVCVPSSCSQPDVERILQAYLNRFELIGQVKHCQRAQGSRQDAFIKPNSTVKTIGIKSSALGQSISENFDLLQQYILLAYCVLFTLIVAGTLLDDSHNRPPVAKSASDCRGTAIYVTEGLACRTVAHSVWQRQCGNQHYERQLGERAAPADSRRGGRPESDESRQLGPQKNPLVSFTDPISSCLPAGCSEGGRKILSNDNLSATQGDRATKARGTRRPTQAGGLRKESAKTRANVDPLPIYDEINSPGVLQASNEPCLMKGFLACFSLKSNMRSIGRYAPPLWPAQHSGPNRNANPARSDKTKGMSDIKVIHGLRTLAMVWIIFGHTIGLVSPEMMNNLFALANLSCSSRLLQAALNTTLAVDTFFMISGLVTVVSFVRRCNSAIMILTRPTSDEDLRDIDEMARAESQPKCTTRQCLDQRVGLHGDGGRTDRDEPDEVRVIGASYSVNPASQDASLRLDQAAGFDGPEVEVSSVDSSSSVITSLSSSASSNRCIGLSSKSSSQKNFITARTARSSSASYTQPGQAASGWPADFKPFSWLVMRYLRLTPAYGAIIGLSILMPALGSGPFWPETVGQLGPACRANWWTNLLYVNNFIETSNLCLIHSWYLSNEWQFSLVALVLFGLAYKSRKLTLLVLLSLFVGSSVGTFIVSVDNDYPPTIVTTSPAVADRWEFIYSLYYKPWPHLPSYLVGLVVGCLILRLQLLEANGESPRSVRPATWLDLSPGVRFICWLLATSIAVAVLNSIYPWNMGIHVDPILTGLHSATFRTLWAACCAWLVFALVSRPRNPLALILSWHGFHITSRLTYCAYLVHPLVIFYHFGMLRERIDSSVYGQLHRFMGTLLMSYILAFVVSICFESPFIRLQNFLAKLWSRSSGAAGSATCRGQAEQRGKSNRKPGASRRMGAASGTTVATDPNQLSSDTSGGIFNGEANLSSSSSLLKSPNSFESEGSMTPLKLTRDQITGQFIVRPVDLAGDDGRHMDDYSLPAAHRFDSGAEQHSGQHVCSLHDSLAGSCNQRTGSNHSGVDEEFQKKLAQAIGRGFKIRSKIVNGANNVAGIQTRRTGQAKRVPELASREVGSVPMLASDVHGQRIRPSQHKLHKPLAPRRTEAFSTFVSQAPNVCTTLDQNNSGRY